MQSDWLHLLKRFYSTESVLDPARSAAISLTKQAMFLVEHLRIALVDPARQTQSFKVLANGSDKRF